MKLFIVTGEPSGDALAAGLVRVLRQRLQGQGDKLTLAGIGGERLAEEGLTSLFPQSDIAVMGFSAVIARLPTILSRLNQTVEAVLKNPPDLLLTVDSPDFCLRVAKRVRRRNPAIPVVHWVCPSVWAWRPGRAPRMRPHVDRLLTLLPFEPQTLAELKGPPGTYVGHPLIERLDSLRPVTPDEQARRDDPVQPEILLLPGSRQSEIRFLLPTFLEAADLVARERPGVRFVLPAVRHMAAAVEAEVAKARTKPRIVTGEEAKLAAFRGARAALAASGTVTLELALARVPTVAAYRGAPVEAWIARRIVRVASILLPNIILGEQAMPEYLQNEFQPETLAAALLPLIDGGETREAQLAAFTRLEEKMRPGDASPSERAADVVMEMARR